VVALLDESPRAACCALDERGELAVAGYLDGSLRTWRRRVPLARRADEQRLSVYGCAVAAAGDIVITAGQDGALRRWDSALRPLGPPLVDRGLPLATGVWACAGSRTLDRTVTALVGGAVQAWDTAAASVTTLAGHAGHVNAVATSGDGDVVASAGFDGTVRLWNPAAAAAAANAEPFSAMIQTLVLSADGRRVLTVDAYGVVRIGNTEAPAAERVVTTCQSWCRDGAAATDLGTVVVIDHAGTVEVWDVDRPGRRHALPHRDAAACLLVDDRVAVTAGDDGTCHGWDVVRGVRIWTAELGRGVPVLATDGAALLAAAGPGPVRLLDPATGRGTTLRDHGATVLSVAFGPHGLVAVGTDTGQVLRWRTRDATAEPPVEAHGARVLRVAPGTERFPFLSTAADGELALWPSAPGARAQRWIGHTGPVRGAAVDPLTGLVASAGDDKILRVWTASGTRQAELPLTGNGQTVAVQHGLIACGDDGGFVHLATLCDHVMPSAGTAAAGPAR
jgi:WD40 repeat protein